MRTFREFQPGTIIFYILVPIHIFVTYAWLTQMGTRPMTLPSFLFVNAVFGLVYMLFYGMTTLVDEERVRVIYGIGLIQFSFSLDDIKSVEVVSNPWYYGWGIRLIPRGMLYNIRGLEGVEITRKSKSRVVRIGSSQREALRESILYSKKSLGRA